MRKEAAKYAAEIAKKENERRRASAPLEKLQAYFSFEIG